MNKASDRQRIHYDAILNEYDRHYFDAESLRYRRRFFYQPLFANQGLDGKRILDLACGSGYNSLAILETFPNAEVYGLDISPEACRNYEHIVNRPAYCVDLTSISSALPAPADAALIIGGLHHCVSNLPATIENLTRLITPGGLLLIVEPNAEFLFNALRMFWYRHDRYFEAETERPLHYSDLTTLFGSRFEPIDVHYMGGPGYFLVLNSLMFRLPKMLKRLVSAPLLGFDALYNRLPGIAPFPYFLARWRRVML